MTPTDLLLFRFLLASGTCLAVGLGVWSLTTLWRRRFPDVAAQRTVWLTSQIAVLATFLIILLPHSERLRVVPAIDLDHAVESRFILPDADPASASPVAASMAHSDVASSRSWLAYAALAWLTIYVLGLAWSITRLLRAQRILASLAAAGNPVHALHQHDGFSAALPGTATPTVIEVDAPISPMLFGLLRPRLLLPQHLRSFDSTQQQLIVEHELTHLRRHDLYWMSAGVLLETLLWFNPFMRLLREHLLWAQELGCDREVLRGRPQAQRKAYATALLAQLKLQHRTLNTALAFGCVSTSSVAARIGLIRAAGHVAQRRWTRWAAVAGLVGVLIASLTLQPALAWRGTAASAVLFSCTEMVDASNGMRLLHEGHCDERVSPASTFNIAVSLMGYDSGFLHDEHGPALPFKQGYADWVPAWRAETDPSSWFERSVVWYTQKVTAQLGAARFQDYVHRFEYGNEDLAGDAGKNNGLSMAWIASSLQISPIEQVAFLRKIVNRTLPISAQAYEMTSRIMKPEVLANGWVVQGKTGTMSPTLANGKDDELRQYGWYVGWAKKDGRTLVFSRLVLDHRQDDSAAGPRVKRAFLADLATRLDKL